MVNDDGQADLFNLNMNTNNWDAPPGVHDELIENPIVPVPLDANYIGPPPPPRWVLTRKDQWQRIYDTTGRLLYHTDSTREPPLAIRIAHHPDDGWHDPEPPAGFWRIRDMTICLRLAFHYEPGTQRLERICEEYGQSREWVFHYDAVTGYLESVEMRRNTTADPECDDGICQSIWTISFTYDSDGRIETLTDKEGHVYEMDYNDAGRLSQATPPSPDAGDSVDNWPNAQVFTYQHVAEPLGVETQYTDPRLKQWDFEFDLEGVLRSMTDPLSRESLFAHDADYNVTGFTNERAATWTATYDDRGNRLSLTDPLGQRREWTYDAFNNLTSITPPLDASGNVDTSKCIEFDYEDYVGVDIADFTHLTRITEPPDGQGSTSAETNLAYYHESDYESVGELKSITDTNGVQNRFEYRPHHGTINHWWEGPDETGLRSATYPVETRIDQMNCDGNPLETDGWNYGADQDYDPQGNPIDGECEPVEGFGIQTRDAFYDPPLDDYMPVENCADYVPMPNCFGSCGVRQYDRMGNLESAALTIQAVYNAIYLDTQFPNTNDEMSARSLTCDYDAVYRLRTVMLETQEPTATSTNYDDLNRPSITRAYAFTPNEVGDVVSMTGPDSAVTEYVYDDVRRLIEVEVDSNTVVTYDYTQWETLGRVTATFANGTSTEWTFDAANQLDHVTHKNGGTVLLDLDYTWTPDGLVDSIAETGSGGSYTVDFTYDKRGRLINETRTGGSGLPPQCYNLGYTYDQVGNRLSMTDYLADPDVVTTFHYDYQNPNWLDDYGTMNNRLIWQETWQDTSPEPTPIQTKWYDYWRGGHVERIVTEEATTPGNYFVEHFQYNGAQQMWLYRTFTCQADAQREPTNVVGVAAWEFRYAGNRQRYLVRERDPNIPDWSDSGHPPYLTPLNNGQWHDYVGDQIYSDFTMNLANPLNPVVNLGTRYHHGGEGDGALVAMDGGPGYTLANRRFFHGDMLGTTRLLTSTGGAITQSTVFTAFGELLGSAPTNMSRYGYCGTWGYQADGLADSGWTGPDAMQVGARWYVPSAGRFLARDPDGILGELNVYAYCGLMPTGYVDPTGTIAVCGDAMATAALGAFLDASIAVGAIAVGAAITDAATEMYKEHTKKARKSTGGKHQKGQKAAKRKNGDKKRQKPSWKPRGCFFPGFDGDDS